MGFDQAEKTFQSELGDLFNENMKNEICQGDFISAEVGELLAMKSSSSGRRGGSLSSAMEVMRCHLETPRYDEIINMEDAKGEEDVHWKWIDIGGKLTSRKW